MLFAIDVISYDVLAPLKFTAVNAQNTQPAVNPVNPVPPTNEILPLAEWSILVAVAVLLIKHLMQVNRKLIDEITDDKTKE